MRKNNFMSVFAKIMRLKSGCWVWLGNTAPNGYGLIRINGEYMGAHRVAWLAMGNEIPEGKQIDHICCRKNCVNPQHLQVVTGSENQRLGYERQSLCRRGLHLKKIGYSICPLCREQNRRRLRSSPATKRYQMMWQRKRRSSVE